MRKKQQKGRTVKMKLDKCPELCIFHDKVMGAVARELSADNSVVEFHVNIPLHFSEALAFPSDLAVPAEPYMSDFYIKYEDGRMAVREAVYRKHLERPGTIALLELSRLYWRQHGVNDWKIITEEEDDNGKTE